MKEESQEKATLQEVRAKHLPQRKVLFGARHRLLLKLYIRFMRYVGIPIVALVSLVPGLLYVLYLRLKKMLKRLRHGQNKNQKKVLRHPAQKSKSILESEYKLDVEVDYEHHSQYITMHDGVRLAIDVLMPSSGGRCKRSCILHQTRYHRSSLMWGPAGKLFGPKNGKPVDWMNLSNKSRLLREGYVVVSADVRGTGASFGKFSSCWSHDERMDSTAILDWIVEQPWSNGEVGLYGISYDATNALFTVEKRHPAVKAAAVLYPFLDLFEDVGAPGGAKLHVFAENWSAFCESQDANWPAASEKVWQYLLPIFMEGVTPVEGQEQLLSKAVAEHEHNWEPGKDLAHVRTKDQVLPSGQVSLDELYIDSEEPVSGSHATPTLLVSGWFDITARGALAGFQRATSPQLRPRSGPLQPLGEATPGLARQIARKASGRVAASEQVQRLHRLVLASACREDSELVIGPWTHGGTQFVRPGKAVEHGRTEFDDVGMLAEFFRRHLSAPSAAAAKAPGGESAGLLPSATGQRLQLFVMGSEDWLAFECWPPPNLVPRRFHFSPPECEGTDGSLRSEPTADREAWCAIRSPSASPLASPFPGQTRWEALTDLFTPVKYEYGRLLPDWKHRGNWVSVVGSPLAGALVVVGQPLVNLRVRLSRVANPPVGDEWDDAQLFVYLVGLRGGDVQRPYYVTEGVKRLSRTAPHADPEDAPARLESLHASFRECAAEYHQAVHTYRSDDVRPVKLGEAVEVAVALQPTAMSFEAGDALQIVVAASDAAHFDPLVPAAGVQIEIQLATSNILLPNLPEEEYQEHVVGSLQQQQHGGGVGELAQEHVQITVA